MAKLLPFVLPPRKPYLQPKPDRRRHVATDDLTELRRALDAHEAAVKAREQS